MGEVQGKLFTFRSICSISWWIIEDEKDFWMDFILECFKFYSAPLEPWRALTSKTIKTDIQHELCIKIQPIY